MLDLIDHSPPAPPLRVSPCTCPTRGWAMLGLLLNLSYRGVAR